MSCVCADPTVMAVILGGIKLDSAHVGLSDLRPAVERRSSPAQVVLTMCSSAPTIGAAGRPEEVL